MNKKVLIFGANGKIGEALTRILLQETECHVGLVSRIPLQQVLDAKVYIHDIEQRKELKNIVADFRPDVIVNCIAMTDVDKCESERQIAWDLNVSIPETLAKIAFTMGSQLIHYSTDYIFDGKKGLYTEEDLPDPLSYYGKSKLAGENAIIGSKAEYSIVRTNVVYGLSSYGKGDFIRWLITKLTNEEQISIITGQYCNPTLADDIAWGTWKLIQKKMLGIYNMAGSEYLNRFEIATAVADVFDINPELIKAVSPDTFKQAAQRPEKGGLDTMKFSGMTGFKFSPLRDGLYYMKNKLKY